tara:strand:- start:595 stop:783 length:189 start_codon:yes stop_codon:yes gene_type:complete
MKFNDYILELTNGLIGSTNDVTYGISKNEPIKKEIKKVYKKQQKLSKAVVIYKPKLNFEKDK